MVFCVFITLKADVTVKYALAQSAVEMLIFSVIKLSTKAHKLKADSDTHHNHKLFLQSQSLVQHLSHSRHCHLLHFQYTSRPPRSSRSWDMVL